MENNEREFVTPDQAIAMLNVDADENTVHTFRQSVAGMLIGADWDRDRAEAEIRSHGMPELAGPTATGMGHGVVLVSKQGSLYFATKPAGQAVAS